jgi:dTMP kinase
MANTTLSGTLISFEGGEGGGKSTQMELLAEKLRAAGQEVLTLREPGGTPIGEAIRELVLSPKYPEMAFTTEVLLFQAQRAQLYSQVVLPALQEGKIILIDRSRDSSLIYQGIVRGFGEELIEKLNTISTHDMYPKITFLFDIPVEIGLKRRADAGDQNRLDAEKKEFHQQVREAYLATAKANVQGRWYLINAAEEPQEVAQEVWQVVTEILLKT